MRVDVFTFQPFQSRAGGGEVIGLRFAYSAALVHVIKDALKRHKALAVDSARHIRHAGGWLPEARVWFIERPVWAAVRANLVRAGATIEEIPRPADVPHYPAPAAGGHLVAEARRLGLQLIPKRQDTGPESREDGGVARCRRIAGRGCASAVGQGREHTGTLAGRSEQTLVRNGGTMEVRRRRGVLTW